MNFVHRALRAGAAALLALACSREPHTGPHRTALYEAVAPSHAAASSTLPALDPALEARLASAGDAAHGRELVAKYQCNRCHEGTGLAAAERNQHCVDCHQQNLSDTFPASRAALERWKPHVNYVRRVPSLVGAAARFEPALLARFIYEPYDVRPLLLPSMPRFGMSPEEARDIAAYLTQGAEPVRKAPPQLFARANPKNGRFLLETRACGTCHSFSGVPALPVQPNAVQAEHEDAPLLAPDLAFARSRLRPSELLRWLTDPRAVKSDTLMTPTGFSESEALDVATYILFTPLDLKPMAQAKRLPPLNRPVTYAEIDEKVLHVTCRHCHSNPDISLGDGGPGNTGGLGFTGRGIDFSSYAGTQSGYLDAHQERRSLFEATADGSSRLVAALLARKDEEAGHPRSDVRGMPLGLPSLTLEQIQLVDTWVAQGRPR